MTNNEILRKIRYIYDFSDTKMIELFNLAEYEVDRSSVSDWLKKDDDPMYVKLTDRELAIFLNGLIIENRGKREGPIPKPEDPLSNNMILKKMKIALNLPSDDILELFNSVDRKLSSHELSAFFRNANHKSYRPLLDQYLRNFFMALQLKHKPK